MPDRKIGWAFVGTSGWVASRFAPSVLAAGHRLVGAFGSSAQGSARFAERFGATAYASLENMLADGAVDAVWVASPTAAHPEHALAAAAAGHAVLVEKPVAGNAASARELASRLSGAPGLTGVGFQHRFNPAVSAIADALAQGRVGELSSLVIQHSIAGPPAPATWRNDPANGGWSVADLGTHLIDIARYLLPGTTFWAARLTSPGRGLPVDDESWVMLAHGEATVVIRASTGAPAAESYIEAVGTKGWVRASGFWAGGGRIAGSDGTAQDLGPADLYARQVAAFSAALDGAAWTGATLDDGAAVSELLAAAWRFTRERAAAG